MQVVYKVANNLNIEPSPKLAKILYSLFVNGIMLSGYLIYMIVK